MTCQYQRAVDGRIVPETFEALADCMREERAADGILEPETFDALSDCMLVLGGFTDR